MVLVNLPRFTVGFPNSYQWHDRAGVKPKVKIKPNIEPNKKHKQDVKPNIEFDKEHKPIIDSNRKHKSNIEFGKEHKQDVKEPDTNKITYEEEKVALILGTTAVFTVWWMLK